MGTLASPDDNVHDHQACRNQSHNDPHTPGVVKAALVTATTICGTVATIATIDAVVGGGGTAKWAIGVVGGIFTVVTAVVLVYVWRRH
ncbi:hypothetical protein ACFP2T_46685 [Plantactinospora solaniradicis]|uniref:Uncharacterized protein n=1 Tax=Plantactinospora solaniradicis TaxID=1723736 RepID=A0ABW1KQE1_9ACTN